MSILVQVSDKIRSFLQEGQARSIKAKKHILASILIKGCSVIVGFLLVPLTIGYVDDVQYGIWLTLSSIVGWFSFFDVGLGHGLRNKFAEALAKNDRKLARVYVSTAYAILGALMLGFLLFFVGINPLLDWAGILNAPDSMAQELSLVALIVFSFFSVTFVLKLIHTMFLGDQRPAMVGFTNLIINVLSLGLIFVLTYTTEGSLLNLGLVLSLTPVLVLGITTLIFFARDYRDFIPGFKYVEFKYFKDLMSLGLQFFAIQVIAVIIFSTDNLIITQLFGPAAVTPYNIAFKYFGMVTQIFNIISTPFWSAYTDAYVKGDIDWIERTNKKLVNVWKLMALGSLVMLVGADLFYSVWVPMVEVPFTLSLSMCIYVNMLAWGNIFVMFINGVGKIRLQLWMAAIGGILNIPLSIFFAKTLGFGSPGVIIASMICIFYGPLVAPIQYKKLIKKTAKGIWNK